MVWGGIIFGAIFIGLFVIVILILVFGRMGQRSWAKRKAKLWIEKGEVDDRKLENVLKILAERRKSYSKDVESSILFRKLTDLSEKEE